MKHHTLETILTDADDNELRARVDYDFDEGCPTEGPSFHSGGQPPELPDVTITKITRLDTMKEIDLDHLPEREQERLEGLCLNDASSWEDDRYADRDDD